MKKLSFLFLLISSISLCQTNNEIGDQKGKWFFGAEIGSNTKTSSIFGEPNPSLQGGLLVEYYFAKRWSVLGRLKYFKTGVTFSKEGFDGTYLSEEGYYGVFRGKVISVPVDAKWQYRIHKNLGGNLKVGLAYNYETESHYDFSENRNTDFPKNFASLNTGFGFHYFLSNQIAIYLDFENYLLGGYKGNSNNFITFSKNYYTENNLLNLGVKYSFKK